MEVWRLIAIDNDKGEGVGVVDLIENPMRSRIMKL